MSGCGQGTQALGWPGGGCAVTGVDPSAALLGRFASAAAADGLSVELLEGRIEDLDTLFGGRRFDLVCAHGVLMYLADRRAAITQLARHVAGADGRLSFTVRNGHTLAMRPGLRGDWAGAIEAFDGTTYIDELGVDAHADRLEAITDDLSLRRHGAHRVVRCVDLQRCNHGRHRSRPRVPSSGHSSTPRTSQAAATPTAGWLRRLHVVAGRAVAAERSNPLELNPAPAVSTAPNEASRVRCHTSRSSACSCSRCSRAAATCR